MTATRLISVRPASPAVADEHIAIRAVTRTFPAARGQGPVRALGPISLSVQRGEFFAIVGPSGCGKSTLLDLIACLSQPTEGSITFEGESLDGAMPDGIGVVFQEDASYPWLSVYENVAFGLRRHGVDKAEIAALVEAALAFMGLSDFRRAFPSQLSGGMRQRVCIARTLVLRPRLLLLDEPFGALDQQTRLRMSDELVRIWRETGATVILITHALDEAVMLADRIGVMSARPGRFLDIVETGWGEERGSAVFGRERFGRMTAHLWSLLRSEAPGAAAETDA